MNYIGIDLHKRFTHFAVLNEQGQVLDRSRIPTEKEAIISYLSKIKEPAKATLEATRNWYWVFDTIEPMVKELKLTAPSKVRLIAEATVKTDQIDAKVLADLLRTNYLPTSYVPDQETRQRRELLRHRAFLVRIRSKVKNRIHALLDKLGIQHSFDNLFGKTGIEFLKSLKLDWAYQKELDDYLKTLDFFNETEKEQNKIIQKLAKESKEANLLMTIPGIGYHNALLITAEIGDVSRFRDGNKFAAYCGLVPKVHISDRTVRYGHLTKAGDRWLRWIFIEAAHTARRHSLRFKKLYDRVYKKKGSQVAVGAVARELAVVSYYVLKNQTAFKDFIW
jgi:transposase